jgi:hypothetical protein
MTYKEKVLPFVYETGEVSAFDVKRLTDTTCEHKVIQQMVVEGIIDEGEWHRSSTGKRYKIHKLKEQQIELRF